MIPGFGRLTALAFADDCLLFLEASRTGLTQLPVLLSTLDTYAAASGACLNKDKSSFWVLGSPPPSESGSITALTAALEQYGLTFRSPADTSAHLGHPLPLPGASTEAKHGLLRARLAAIKKRAACFRTQGVDLLSRSTSTNKLLGSRLWHTIAIGPLPRDFHPAYSDSISPYLRNGRGGSVSLLTLTTPVQLGGFSLIDPDAMATALSISFVRRFLLGTDAVSAWLRAGLTAYLAGRHGLPPAILLVRRGSAYQDLRSRDTRDDGFFGRLAHALATVNLSLSPEWVHLEAPALLTLPWLRLPGLDVAGRLKPDKVTNLIAKGWLTWGDILWRTVAPVNRRAQTPSHPLGPPPGRSVKRNGITSPFSSGPPSCGPALHRIWGDIWPDIPAPARSSLLEWAATSEHKFAPLPPPAKTTAAQSWVPFVQDPLALHFPWHLLTISSLPLSAISPRSVRRSLQASRGPRTPVWPIAPSPPAGTSPPAEWVSRWQLLAKLPLSSTVRTTNLLVLNRNAWTYHPPPDSDLPPNCPRGCASPDGITHGYFTCPAALEVWTACLPLLDRLGCPRPPDLSPHSLLTLAPFPAPLHPRAALWRSVVIHSLYLARHSAGAAAREALKVPDFCFCSHNDALSSACALIAEQLSLAWAQVQRRPASARPAAALSFERTWISGGSFLRTIGGPQLFFATVSDSPTDAPRLPPG